MMLAALSPPDAAGARPVRVVKKTWLLTHLVWIKDDDVCITAGCQEALAWVYVEHLRCCSAGHTHVGAGRDEA